MEQLKISADRAKMMCWVHFCYTSSALIDLNRINWTLRVHTVQQASKYLEFSTEVSRMYQVAISSDKMLTDRQQQIEMLFSQPLPFFCNALLFYVHSKHLRSCRDSQLT